MYDVHNENPQFDIKLYLTWSIPYTLKSIINQTIAVEIPISIRKTQWDGSIKFTDLANFCHTLALSVFIPSIGLLSLRLGAEEMAAFGS